MPSTKAIDWKRRSSRFACLMGAAMLASGPGQMAFAYEGAAMNVKSNGGSTTELDTRQQAIIPISASAAAGNMDILRGALNQGLDAGLSLAEAREILVQVYAYAGFPRSLNALSELMKVAEARRQRGIQDEAGHEPGKPIPKGDALLAAGTANQTRLAGGPVSGPLFDFAPQANEYLRTHLFGDIFERDNLDWQSRELATVSMLAAMSGVEPQLQSHIGISMNIGVRPEQLSSLADVLEARFSVEAAERVRVSIQRQLEDRQE
ncbi:carboxymuconolactone decarboxylase family protein [Stenotrophomonas pennii]|uniref:carboxymuconolactone decarboxylase family protein n=1 Tax=Stenotrophomonas lacuserhaii TaxID=2760084 RepID=UPI003208C8EA